MSGGSPGHMRPLVISACADEGKHFFVGVFSVGAVGGHAGDIARVVRQLVETLECSDLRSLGPLAMSVVSVSVGAVSERHQLERDMLDFLAVGVLRKDVGPWR